MFCNQDDRKAVCPGDETKFCRCIHTLNINLNDVVEVIVVDGGSQEGFQVFTLIYFMFKYLKYLNTIYNI
jgi:hypothetical protein